MIHVHILSIVGFLYLVFQDQVSSKYKHRAEDIRSQAASGNSDGAESLEAGGNVEHGHG